MKHFKKNISSQEGAVLLELSIVLPILILFFMVSSDFVRALQEQQKISLFSKEMAHAVFQDCLEMEDPDQCMVDTYNRVTNVAQQLLGAADVEFFLTMYSCDLDAANNCSGGIKVKRKCPNFLPNEVTSDIAQVCNSSFLGAGGSRYITHFSGTGFAVDPLKAQGKIVVAESFRRFTPFIGFSPIPLNLYDSAVY